MLIDLCTRVLKLTFFCFSFLFVSPSSLRMVKVFTRDNTQLMFADEYYLVNHLARVWREKKQKKILALQNAPELIAGMYVGARMRVFVATCDVCLVCVVYCVCECLLCVCVLCLLFFKKFLLLNCIGFS